MNPSSPQPDTAPDPLTQEEREAVKFVASMNIPWAQTVTALIRRLSGELAERDRRIAELGARLKRWEPSIECGSGRLEGPVSK